MEGRRLMFRFAFCVFAFLATVGAVWAFVLAKALLLVFSGVPA